MVRRRMHGLVTVAVVCVPVFACVLGGPSASRSFLNYREAFDKAKTIEEVLPYLGAPMRASVEAAPKEQRDAGFRLVKLMNDIIGVKVVKETLAGAEATLDATGTSSLGDDVRGTIVLMKEDGAWKLKSEKWERAPAASGSAAEAPRKSCAELAADLKGGEAAQAKAAAALMQRSCMEAVPALVAALQHRRAGIKGNAQAALGNTLGMAEPAAVASLRSVLPAIVAAKEAAAKADDIGEISLQRALGAFQAEAVPYLIPDLKRPARELRAGAAMALGGIGPNAKDALPALEAAVKDEKDDVTREALQNAIRRIKGA
jgi:hypothetical protein